MLFNLFNHKNKDIENEEPNPYLTKVLSWDDEKITAIRFNGTQKTIYYKDIIRVEIIFDNFYLPVPKWIIQDDSLEDTTIKFYNDLRPDITDLVIEMLGQKLNGYNNEEVHQMILEAMGATMGLFHLWQRDDLDQVLKKMSAYHAPRMEAEIKRIIREAEQEKANKWWRKWFN